MYDKLYVLIDIHQSNTTPPILHNSKVLLLHNSNYLESKHDNRKCLIISLIDQNTHMGCIDSTNRIQYHIELSRNGGRRTVCVCGLTVANSLRYRFRICLSLFPRSWRPIFSLRSSADGATW